MLVCEVHEKVAKKMVTQPLQPLHEIVDWFQEFSQLHCISASWIDSKLSLKCLDLLTKSVKFASFCRLSG